MCLPLGFSVGSSITRENLSIAMGATFEHDFPFVGLSTGDYANAQIRRYAGGPLIASFTTRVLPSVDLVRVSLTAAQTAVLSSGGIYDCDVVTGYGTFRVSEGRVALRPHVSTGTSPTQSPTKWGRLKYTDVTWGELFRSNKKWGAL